MQGVYLPTNTPVRITDSFTNAAGQKSLMIETLDGSPIFSWVSYEGGNGGTTKHAPWAYVPAELVSTIIPKCLHSVIVEEDIYEEEYAFAGSPCDASTKMSYVDTKQTCQACGKVAMRSEGGLNGK